MDINLFYGNENEKPLDRLEGDGGFCGIFRTVGVVGDSLSSGEFESLENGVKGYHDFYDYSWGQYIARASGCKVYNFSKGGMTAKGFRESFGSQCGAFSYDKLCQAYIIALGVNDTTQGFEVGDPHRVKAASYTDANAFIVHYGAIIKILKSKQPGAKFFLMTMPNDTMQSEERRQKRQKFNEAIRALAIEFDNTYILDFEKYAPEYDQKFCETFFLGHHMTATGYMLTAKMVMSYIDLIIRNNYADFKQVAFIGTPYIYNQ